MVAGGKYWLAPPWLTARDAHTLKCLRTGDFVHQQAIDIQQRPSSGCFVHDVPPPEFFQQGQAHGAPSARDLAASGAMVCAATPTGRVYRRVDAPAFATCPGTSCSTSVGTSAAIRSRASRSTPVS